MSTTTNPEIARRGAIGISIGSNTAAQAWVPWRAGIPQLKTTVIEDDSAVGVVEETSDSEVVGQWVENSLEGIVTAESFGFVMLNHFGSVSTGTATGGKYPHTFSVNQTSLAPAMNLSYKSPLQSKRYTKLTIDTLEINAEEQDWVTFSSGYKATTGSDQTETVAFTAEKKFSCKNIVIKKASNVAGLSGATALRVLKFKLNSERPSEQEFPLGNGTDPDFVRGEYKANAEIVVNYQNTDIDDDMLANTIYAMSITMTNGTDILAFTGSKVRTREIERSEDKNEKVTATLQLFFEYDASVGRAIQPVLTNSRTGYVAA
ncbi:phage tail tube protein [Rhodococcus sp. NPDC004095]